jgi:peptidoglycan-associated lipoprotein
MNRLARFSVPSVLLLSVVLAAGCGKKPAPTPPPEETAPVVPAVAPTAHLTAAPTTVSAGDEVVLTWTTTNATSASIDGIGDVPTSGTQSVNPSTSTSYHLVAKGAGGTADATVRVTVRQAPVVEKPAATLSAEEEFAANVKDIFFDYDAYTIRSDAQAVLSADASYLVSHPDVKIVVGGYCDERGSAEYNLGLGQNRGDSAKNALVTAGIAATRIRVISYGKEKPFCTESSEACWQQNRRAGFALDK